MRTHENKNAEKRARTRYPTKQAEKTQSGRKGKNSKQTQKMLAVYTCRLIRRCMRMGAV